MPDSPHDPTAGSALPADPAAITGALLAWFREHRRDLPWRRRRTLYGTWVSEMMLQQTTVATVVPYWERFMDRFPDVNTLAEAPEQDVLAMWSGLGYYRRARHLQAAARMVVESLGGELPRDFDGWRRLPGIGPYAAGAIASLGLAQPVPAVDANVRRVLGRWLGGAPGAADVETCAAALVPRAEPGAWNEALMELGALVCLPRAPRCRECPVQPHCEAARTAGGEAPDVRAAPEVAQPVGVVLVAFRAAGRVWLEESGGAPLRCRLEGTPARSAFAGLHEGLLGLPMTAWYPVPASRPGQAAALERLASGLLVGVPSGAGLGVFRHAITRYRLLASVVAVDLPGSPAGPPLSGRPDGTWAPVGEAAGLHVSQLTRKALRFISPARG